MHVYCTSSVNIPLDNTVRQVEGKKGPIHFLRTIFCIVYVRVWHIHKNNVGCCIVLLFTMMGVAHAISYPHRPLVS